ncbi:hypothetical protein FHR92_000982 [Fontibacillus solani]|uniref:Uncharacterized protein n=1 Tax=Fontibacillus solani TaxID=1572857 RepID=A0A7W3SQR5_9BACL|nr:hypothetical protein [Fontibacillus solani]MBA9084525.1 hypothetical protein [Fontibacillus solani]
MTEYTESEYSEYTDYSEYTNYTDSNNSTDDSENNKVKRICFAILVHNRKEVVIDLLDNIRCYCPNSSIVLFNGGDDPELCHGLGYPVCPTSRKLSYGVTAVYMLEVMRWLEDSKKKYDYLINLDSDALFAKEGYEAYIIREMENKDYMGVGTKVPDDDFYCLIQLRQEKKQWEPLLGQEPYFESFNVGQVYSRNLVQRFLNSDQYSLFHKNLMETEAFGVDELVFATMTDRLGIQVHSYQEDVASTIRYRPHFPLDEMVHYLNQKPDCYLFHPVYRKMKDETRAAVRELMKREIQYDPDIQESFINKDLGRFPYMIRRKKNKSTVMEWIAASEEEGLLYWKVKSGILYGPYSFGSGKVSGLSVLETSYGNIEVICRIGTSLVHFWREDDTGEWFQSDTFAEEVVGMPSFIQSSYGSFEVLAPLKGGGLGHWWRNNDNPEHPWIGPHVFGKDHFTDAILIENNSSQLTAVVLQNAVYKYFVRDDRNSWQWLGPYE